LGQDRSGTILDHSLGIKCPLGLKLQVDQALGSLPPILGKGGDPRPALAGWGGINPCFA